ncbi:Hypothetical predicted protein [Scomber scombrus]|uniref:Secreted protein n=1 Tax=Scomber scombrus TaxID=13677 RepID=A0AAV1NJ84_SCOSC
MLLRSVALTDRLLTRQPAAELLLLLLLESLSITEGDRGRCRRTGNVRDDTHAAHAPTEITTGPVDARHCRCICNFKCVFRMSLRAA